MKILKKTIAVILSVMMVVTVGIVCASAASTQTAPASDDTSTGITKQKAQVYRQYIIGTVFLKTSTNLHIRARL